MFPLSLQLRHEGGESGILADGVQVGITLKERITGEASVSRLLQPLNCQLCLVHPGVGASNEISSVMRGSEAFLFSRTLDLGFGLAMLAGGRQQQGLNTGKRASGVLGILF